MFETTALGRASHATPCEAEDSYETGCKKRHAGRFWHCSHVGSDVTRQAHTCIGREDGNIIHREIKRTRIRPIGEWNTQYHRRAETDVRTAVEVGHGAEHVGKERLVATGGGGERHLHFEGVAAVDKVTRVKGHSAEAVPDAPDSSVPKSIGDNVEAVLRDAQPTERACRCKALGVELVARNTRKRDLAGSGWSHH